jgi:hypothetical protein
METAEAVFEANPNLEFDPAKQKFGIRARIKSPLFPRDGTISSELRRKELGQHVAEMLFHENDGWWETLVRFDETQENQNIRFRLDDEGQATALQITFERDGQKLRFYGVPANRKLR